jgi:glycosyltransferase involved in cell wall biosynthesis
MLVLLDASGYRDTRNGAANRTLHLMPRVMARLQGDHDLLILCHPDLRSVFTARFPSAEIQPWEWGVEGGVRRIRNHSRALKRLCQQRDVGLVMQELRPYSVPEKTIATVHDVRFLRRDLHVGFCKRWGLRLTLPQQLRRARAIVVPSETVKRELVHGLGIDDASVHVIPNGVDAERFAPGVSPNATLGSAPFFLTVGHREFRKNLTLLIRVMGRLQDEGYPHRLVVVGRRIPNYDAPERLMSELNLDDRVVFRDDETDAGLADLYRGATAFLFPSLYEGFGIPLIEAMAAGCPVVATRTPIFEELAASRAIGGLHDPDTWLPEIRRIIGDGKYRAGLVAAGLQCAARFNWDAPADQLAALIREAAHQAPL